jgi:predicted PurR-regulated permease PerM
MFPSDKEQLTTSLKLHIIILSYLSLLYGLIYLTDFLYVIFAILGGTLLISYVLLGPVNYLEQAIRCTFPNWVKRFSAISPRLISVLTVYLFFLTFMVLSGLKIAPDLASQVKDFSQELPSYLSQLEEKVSSISHHPTLQAVLPQSNLKVEPSSQLNPMALLKKLKQKTSPHLPLNSLRCKQLHLNRQGSSI